MIYVLFFPATPDNTADEHDPHRQRGFPPARVFPVNFPKYGALGNAGPPPCPDTETPDQQEKIF